MRSEEGGGGRPLCVEQTNSSRQSSKGVEQVLIRVLSGGRVRPCLRVGALAGWRTGGGGGVTGWGCVRNGRAFFFGRGGVSIVLDQT